MQPSEPLRARAWMRPYALLYLYRRRLRVHTAQELLAGLGIAVAVALVFAVTVANGSIAGSASEVVHAVVGPANLQLRARGSDGFDERMLARVERLPGVRQAAPLLEQTATIVSPDATTAGGGAAAGAGAQTGGRSVTVDLAGTDISLAVLNGLAHTLPLATLSPGGIGLSRASADALGIASATAPGGGARAVVLKLRGAADPLKVTAVLGPEAFGALAQARVAVMPLERLQQLAGLRRRVTRILVETDPGREAQVRAELQRLAGGRLTVAPASQDVALLRQALGPSDQASALFAAISGLLGFLFAFNAMLLTVPERRQAIADLRIAGARRTAIAQMVVFQALCLGVAASLLGLLGGYLLSLGVFHQSPGYLSQAFTLGTRTVIGARPVLVALAAGILATCLASTVPLLDLRRRRAAGGVYFEEGPPGDALGRETQRGLFAAALGLVVVAVALYALAPSAAIVACVVLALATMLAVPLALAGVLAAAGALAARHQRLTILPVALTSLRATTVRSLALAATGAVALFGSVALGGSRDDLLRGIDGYTARYVSGADIWLVNPHDNQAIDDFAPPRPAQAPAAAGGSGALQTAGGSGGRRSAGVGAPSQVAAIVRVPGVAAVNAFQGGFFDLGDRRMWVIAWPPNVPAGLLANQVIGGTTATAIARLRAGGWIAVSQQTAAEHHVGVGGTLTLPTPTGPVGFRVAATTTNFGWTPGAILMSTADYTRAWGTPAPTALGVDVAPGASVTAVRAAIARALGPTSGLEVVTAGAREAGIDASASEGLGQLGEIATLLVLAAILAMVAALGSSIWQRRAWLAGLRLEGTKRGRLRRVLLMEAALLLGAGCLTGAIAGIFGQAVIDRYLRHVTGFPVAGVATGARPFEVFAVVVATVLVIASVPGWIASRVSPTLALDE